LTNALLLDTHIAIWLDTGTSRLARATRDLIDTCRQDGGTIYLSAVSAWEIALLIDAERIVLDVPAESWIERFVDRPGVDTVPLSYRAASRAYYFHHLKHRDPVDRLLIATAIELECPLVTYDKQILQFANRHGPQYRFSAIRE